MRRSYAVRNIIALVASGSACLYISSMIKANFLDCSLHRCQAYVVVGNCSQVLAVKQHKQGPSCRWTAACMHMTSTYCYVQGKCSVKSIAGCCIARCCNTSSNLPTVKPPVVSGRPAMSLHTDLCYCAGCAFLEQPLPGQSLHRCPSVDYSSDCLS